VADGKTITVTSISLTGTKAANYSPNTSTTATANITARTLTITAAGVNKVYDGTASTTATLSNNKVSGDIVTASYTTAVFDTANAGTGKTVSVSGLSISGTDSGNYAFSTTTSTTADITKAALSVTANGDTKTYNAVAYNGGNGVAFSGFVNGEASTTLGGTLTYGGTSQGAVNAGLHAITPSGFTSNNYAFTYHDGTLTVTKANATINVTSYSVTYSGTIWTASSTATGVGGADLSGSLNVSGTVHTNAGTYPTDAWTFTGGTNYNDASGTVSDSIAKASASITINGYTGVYDATAHGASVGTATGVGGVNLSGSVSLGSSFTSAPGGTANWSFTNANYNSQSGTAAVTISKAPLTISAQPNTKVYDSFVTASALPTVSGLQGSTDSVTGLAATYSNKNVGTGKTLSVSAYTVNDSNSGNNYTVTTVATSTGVITAKSLTVTASASSKVYDATTVASVALSDNRISGDVFTVASTSATFASAAVGVEKAVTVAGISISGTDAGNYSVNTTALGVANITARPITATADAQTKVYGATDPALTYTITSGALQGSDAFTGSLTRATGEAVGTHAINQGTLALSSNYTLTYVGANLTVTTAPLTVTSVDASKLFGGTDPVFTYTYSALTNSDTDSVFTGSLARTAGESVGTTTINLGTLSAGSNYAVTFVPGVFTINVNPASTVESIATSTNPDMTVSGTITNTSQTSGHGVGLTVVVDIPADITVTGTSTWDGTFTLPTVTTNAFIVGTAGTVITSIEAIEIGAGDTPLSLDKAVKLTFAGKAGTLVGWSQAGSFHSITNTCDSATAPTLGADADCKIDVGNDLVIWTKHFSKFISYKELSDTL
ncbi:MAG: beta strand repeat-containing protein, partial [Chthoniobacterales bacterium]